MPPSTPTPSATLNPDPNTTELQRPILTRREYRTILFHHQQRQQNANNTRPAEEAVPGNSETVETALASSEGEGKGKGKGKEEKEKENENEEEEEGKEPPESHSGRYRFPNGIPEPEHIWPDRDPGRRGCEPTTGASRDAEVEVKEEEENKDNDEKGKGKEPEQDGRPEAEAELEIHLELVLFILLVPILGLEDTLRLLRRMEGR